MKNPNGTIVVVIEIKKINKPNSGYNDSFTGNNFTHTRSVHHTLSRDYELQKHINKGRYNNSFCRINTTNIF